MVFSVQADTLTESIHVSRNMFSQSLDMLNAIKVHYEQEQLATDSLVETSTRELSADPNHLGPWVETTWRFTYTITNTYTDTISCGNSVDYLSTGGLMIFCASQNGSKVGIGYNLESEIYLIVIIHDLQENYSSYWVSLDDCCDVTGFYFPDSDNPDIAYELVGTRLYPPQVQCSEKECNYSVQINQPGFYIATVNLPEGGKEGMWGVEFSTSGGINAGGFNSGAVLKEDGDSPGFMAFYLSQAESVDITPYEYTGEVSRMKIKVKRRENGVDKIVFGPVLTRSGQTYATPVLQPGFYVAEGFSETDSPRGRFGFEVSARSMTGGVNIGGWIDSYTGGNGQGFGGLYVANSQIVDINVFFGESYSSIGSDYIELNVYRLQENGERTLMFSGTQ